MVFYIFNKQLKLTGEYLEKQVSEYAKEKEIDEGKLWEELNNEFKMIYGTNQQLAKEEYQVAKFQKKIDDLDYKIENIKRAVPKNEITGKDEDKFIITEKEVAVRKIWNVSNTAGAFKSFTDKEEAMKYSKKINKEVLEYLK